MHFGLVSLLQALPAPDISQQLLFLSSRKILSRPTMVARCSSVFSWSGCLVILSVVCLAVSVEQWENNSLVKSSADPDILRKLRALTQDVRDRGCEVNLCFALQGDDFVTEKEFKAQKDFVDLMVAILTTDEPGNYCAVQYGRTTKRISPLTGRKIQFLNKVARSTQVGGSQTNIAAALGYTGFQLRPRQEDANKIIILGDGLETIGFGPRFIARRIRKEGTRICAVAVGGFSTTALQAITGDENLIFEINSFFDLAEVVVGFVNDVCGFQ